MLDDNNLNWLKERQNPYYICKTYCEYFYKIEGSTKEEGCCMFPADDCFIRDNYNNFNIKKHI